MSWTSVPDTLGEGPEGDRGLTGGLTFYVKIESNTTAPPSDGFIRLNDNDLTLATRIFISTIDRNSEDISGLLSDLQANDYLRIFNSNESNFVAYKITEIISSGGTNGYAEIEVVYVTGTGVFADGENISIGLGKAGPTGPQGSSTGDLLKRVLQSDVGTFSTDEMITFCIASLNIDDDSTVVFYACAKYITAPPGVTTEFYYTIALNVPFATETEYEGVIASSSGSDTINVPATFVRRHYLTAGSYVFRLYKRGTSGGGSVTSPFTMVIFAHPGVDI